MNISCEINVAILVFCNRHTGKPSVAASEHQRKLAGVVYKTLGRRNLNYQIKTFNQNAQPCYVVIDADGKVLSDGVFVYDPKASAATKAEGFVKFLEKALE